MLLLNTKWNILVIYTDCNFNTSNVTIKHAQFEMTCIGEYHFNTSNVTIKQQLCETSYLCMFHFNTSNVTIKLGHISEGFVSFVVISIHLMLLLNLVN